MENQKQFNTGDYWELEKIIYQDNKDGAIEYAYLINRLRGEIKKVRVN